MKFVFACAVSVFFLPIFVFAAANVIINEIAWMGTSVSANDEWIELKNTGMEAVDLTGWRLEAADGQPATVLSGSIGAVGYFLLERTNDETVPGIAADLIYTGALSNSGEKLELKNAAGTIVDSIDAASGWPAGDNTTKETMQKVDNAWITAAATPRAANERAMNQESGIMNQGETQTNNTSSPMIHDSILMIQESKKLFTVDAGEDIKTVAGAEVRFHGAAYGLDGKLLDDTSGNVRYLWNFGDGTFFDGKNTNHIYRYSGTYRAVLEVSSGQTSGSGAVEVMVGESNIAISEIGGAWIELANEGAATVDVSTWQIRSDTGAYALPARTLIGPGAFVVFSQETTGLLFGPVNPKAELRYANGTLADSLFFVGTLLPGKSVIRDEKGKGAIGGQTPGKENMNHELGIMNQGKKEKSTIQHGAPLAKQEKKQAIIHDSRFMIQSEESQKIELPEKTHILRASLTDSNYFWLAVSISLGLIAGAVVLVIRPMIG